MDTITDFECVVPGIKHWATGAWMCEVIWASGKREKTNFHPDNATTWEQAVQWLETNWLGRNPREELKARILAPRVAKRDPELDTVHPALRPE